MQLVDYAYTLYNGDDAGEMLYLKTRFQIARLVEFDVMGTYTQ